VSQLSQNKRPSMNDVADLAGVSQTTVSFVINNTPDAGIPEKTKQRVWAAVKELSYRPNVLAQSLRMQRSGIIGFVSDTIAITPQAGKIFEGAQDVAWAHGKILLLVNTKNNPELKIAGIDMLLARQVEGIIYGTMFHRPVDPPKALSEVPTVLLDCFTEDRRYPSVVPDEVGGGQKATEILINKGHRRIAFINCTDPVPAAFGRLDGYRSALASYSIPYDEALVCASMSNPDGGYRCAQALMQLPDPPTAIFCFNDRMAMGAYDALRKLGKNIPNDVAIMGFDNQELIAAYLYPPLSTMELPHLEMGKWAVTHLLQLISGEKDIKPVQHKIACPYVERESI
jgi:LacI family transcriptional regulator